jgi:hypothetical protein
MAVYRSVYILEGKTGKSRPPSDFGQVLLACRHAFSSAVNWISRDAQ